jgi:L-iditol 2-dehydrogenase
LLALQLAKAAGASVALLGIEADRARLELARQLGADHTLEITGVNDVQAAVQDLFHDEGIDLVIECSGAGPAAETLLNLVRRGGRFCQMGLLKFVAERRISVQRLITHRFPLDAWDQALHTAQTKQGVKILLKPS